MFCHAFLSTFPFRGYLRSAEAHNCRLVRLKRNRNPNRKNRKPHRIPNPESIFVFCAQSAVSSLYLVCILYPVCSLQFAFVLAWSQNVSYDCSLNFTPAVQISSSKRSRNNASVSGNTSYECHQIVNSCIREWDRFHDILNKFRSWFIVREMLLLHAFIPPNKEEEMCCEVIRIKYRLITIVWLGILLCLCLWEKY